MYLYGANADEYFLWRVQNYLITTKVVSGLLAIIYFRKQAIEICTNIILLTGDYIRLVISHALLMLISL